MYKALKKEVAGAAADRVPDYDEEKMARAGRRSGGYTCHPKPRPKRPRQNSGGSVVECASDR